MLEIWILIKGSQKLIAMAKDRGIAGWPFVILFIFLWFGGEIGGAIAGFIVLGAQGDGFNFGVYLCAVAGAAIGVAITFGIMAAIPKSPPRYDDELDQPRRRAIDEDDDFDRPIRPRDQKGLDDPRFRDRPS